MRNKKNIVIIFILCIGLFGCFDRQDAHQNIIRANNFTVNCLENSPKHLTNNALVKYCETKWDTWYYSGRPRQCLGENFENL